MAAARAAVPVTVSALTRAPERPAALQRSANANESIQRPGPTPSQTAAPVVSAAMLAEPREPREPRIYALNELPEPIRRELPTLTVGGAMHSDHPASRMLILNGQVFHERDLIAPNLTLVQVQLKSALLEFRGYRYRITY